MKGLNLFFSLLLIFILSSSAVNCCSGDPNQWQILTKHNFSSQIRLHPHILLLVSFPWSGESRSLMKEISRLVGDRGDELGTLVLMHINRKKDKMLSDAIGASDGISILYYHHSFGYKYRGRLVARNVISSIVPYLSASPDEIPLTWISSKVELSDFLDSTDKALLLLEFCGWTNKLLDSKRINGTFQFGYSAEESSVGDTVGAQREENLKFQGEESASLQCGIPDWFSVFPRLREFRSDNATSFQDNGSVVTADAELSSCNIDEFKKFDTFLSGFINIAREFFLPSEKYRFGLVSDSSLLSSLLVEASASWSTMLYYNGCPSCSKILQEGEDLRAFLLKNDKPIVKELERDGQDLDPALPANEPSVILFVDRFSDSSETKQNSKEALQTLRRLALQHKISDQEGQQNGVMYHRHSSQALQGYRSVSGHPKLKLYSVAQKLKLKEKLSVMIVNDGKHAILENLGSDLQGSSLQEILTRLLQQKKEVKLSSVAKEVGFRLLSDDMEIKLPDKLPLEPQVGSTLVTDPPSEDIASTVGNLDKDSASEHEKESESTSENHQEKETYVDSNGPSVSATADQLVSDDRVITDDAKTSEEKEYVDDDWPEEEELQLHNFGGSFYVSEGNYRLLKALTGGTRIPSLVIIDPISQLHFVFPKDEVWNYSSVEDFLSGFLDGTLIPYQLTESASENPSEGSYQPFVKVDFHGVDPIPQISSQSFSEQVLGFNESENDKASHPWKEDVLILFSNSWCGFCQRMELVVREVYRAIKGYMSKKGPLDREILHKDDNLKNAVKYPKIFLMDCPMNDCSLILKTNNLREVYPTLLLFPAEGKPPVPYEGDTAVADVIRFVANHGSCSHYLSSDKGILHSVAKRRGRNPLKDAPTKGEASITRDKSYEIQLKNQVEKSSVHYSHIKTPRSDGIHHPEVAVGSILVATEKINTHPFDNSMVLIVKADQSAGFQGLIYNKPIRWDALQDLGQGLEALKEAPLSFGGPLMIKGMPFLALTKREAEDEYPAVAAGIYLVDQAATMNEIELLKSGNRSVDDYWFFLGFSSWGWDQLFDEIAGGAWNVSTSHTGNLVWPSSG